MRYATLQGFWRRHPSLKAAVEALVHSNVFISVAAASVAVTTMLLADLPLSAGPPGLVFAATLFVYSVNRVTDLEEDAQNTPRRATFTRRYGRYILAAGVVAYLGATGAAVALSLPRAYYMVLPLVVVVLYSLAGLKRVLLVKNLLVGGSWGVIVLGTGAYFGALRAPAVLFLFGYVTSVLTVAAVVFDIKDVEGDREAGISTVPNVWSPAVTRRVAGVANFGVALAVVAVVLRGVMAPAFLSLLALNAYVAAYIPAATPDRGPLFYGFVVDGEHIFLAAVVGGLHLLGVV